jgi:threonine 3-dehydrogenase
MKALVKLKAEPGLWLTDVAEPTYGPNDMLIKVRNTAICGTDLHIYKWDAWAQRTVPVPLTVGHEFMGEVVAMGSEVSGFRVGDRVSGEGHITCGHCRNCRAGRRHLCRLTIGLGVQRPGCFAEYVSLPAANVFKLPAEINDEVGAVLDPLGNATHTALSFDLVGEDVLITGAGPIGLMAIKVARHAGARFIVITDVNPYRLQLAEKMGATCAIDPIQTSMKDVMKELGIVEGFDVGLEMSGHSTSMDLILQVMNHGGQVGILGIPVKATPVDWNPIIFKGLTLKGIYGREMFETWYKMASMLKSGLDISAAITHRYPAEEFEQAFQAIMEGRCGKVILNW